MADNHYVLFLLLVASFVMLGGCETFIATECFGKVLSLSCKQGHRIKIIDDFFGLSEGRVGGSACQYVPGDCYVVNTRQTSVIHRYCEGEETCQSFQVDRRMCDKGNATNYEQVEYECVPDNAVINMCTKMSSKTHEGYIATPSFPKVYPPNQHCECSLRSLTRRAEVRLSFIHFTIRYDKPCRDWVDITMDGNTRHMCGPYHHASREMSSRAIQLTFHSDASKGHEGMWLYFSADPHDSQGIVEVECGPVAYTTSTTTSAVTTAKPPPTTTRELIILYQQSAAPRYTDSRHSYDHGSEGEKAVVGFWDENPAQNENEVNDGSVANKDGPAEWNDRGADNVETARKRHGEQNIDADNGNEEPTEGQYRARHDLVEHSVTRENHTGNGPVQSAARKAKGHFDYGVNVEDREYVLFSDIEGNMGEKSKPDYKTFTEHPEKGKSEEIRTDIGYSSLDYESAAEDHESGKAGAPGTGLWGRSSNSSNEVAYDGQSEIETVIGNNEAQYATEVDGEMEGDEDYESETGIGSASPDYGADVMEKVEAMSAEIAYTSPAYGGLRVGGRIISGSTTDGYEHDGYESEEEEDDEEGGQNTVVVTAENEEAVGESAGVHIGGEAVADADMDGLGGQVQVTEVVAQPTFALTSTTGHTPIYEAKEYDPNETNSVDIRDRVVDGGYVDYKLEDGDDIRRNSSPQANGEDSDSSDVIGLREPPNDGIVSSVSSAWSTSPYPEVLPEDNTQNHVSNVDTGVKPTSNVSSNPEAPREGTDASHQAGAEVNGTVSLGNLPGEDLTMDDVLGESYNRSGNTTMENGQATVNPQGEASSASNTTVSMRVDETPREPEIAAVVAKPADKPTGKAAENKNKKKQKKKEDENDADARMLEEMRKTSSRTTGIIIISICVGGIVLLIVILSVLLCVNKRRIPNRQTLKEKKEKLKERLSSLSFYDSIPLYDSTGRKGGVARAPPIGEAKTSTVTTTDGMQCLPGPKCIPWKAEGPYWTTLQAELDSDHDSAIYAELDKVSRAPTSVGGSPMTSRDDETITAYSFSLEPQPNSEEEVFTHV